MERTLVIIKPDAVQRGLVGPIVGRLEARGFKIVGMKLMQIDRGLASRHYAAHEGKPFYTRLVDYITSGPVVAMALEGPNAVEAVRRSMGTACPEDADVGTIRADYALSVGRNLVHGSDSPDAARQEIDLFFFDAELVSWARDTDRWIYE